MSITPPKARSGSAAARAMLATDARYHRALARMSANAGIPWLTDAARAAARRVIDSAPPKERAS
jgi:hypothetical protein